MPRSRSDFTPGIAKGLAAATDIPAYLALHAGETGGYAMMALKRALDAGDGSLRGQYLLEAQQHISRLNPARHSLLIQHLNARAVSLGGRGADTHLAHVAPGEVVIPRHLQTPEFMAGLDFLARAAGIDPASLRVGSGRNAINPRTGLPEFDDEGEEDAYDGEDGSSGNADWDSPDDPGTDSPTPPANDPNTIGTYYDNGMPIDGMTVTAAGSSGQPATKTCVGTARVLQGNPNTIGRVGGLGGGTTVTPNSAAIIQQQFGVPKGQLRQYGPQITGTLNGSPLFHGIGDIIGGKSPIPGVGVRNALQRRYPGQLILELPSAPKDMGSPLVTLNVPGALPCPAGTQEEDDYDY